MPFQERLQDFKTKLATLERDGVPEFYAEDADYRGSGDVLFANADVTRALQRDLSHRGASEIVAIRQIDQEFTLVDSVFDDDGTRGWFTEVWAGPTRRPGSSPPEPGTGHRTRRSAR
jgi:hypothetical protein